jgi:hypothetical protein
MEKSRIRDKHPGSATLKNLANSAKKKKKRWGGGEDLFSNTHIEVQVHKTYPEGVSPSSLPSVSEDSSLSFLTSGLLL